jgi:hypothetical protein
LLAVSSKCRMHRAAHGLWRWERIRRICHAADLKRTIRRHWVFTWAPWREHFPRILLAEEARKSHDPAPPALSVACRPVFHRPANPSCRAYIASILLSLCGERLKYAALLRTTVRGTRTALFLGTGTSPGICLCASSKAGRPRLSACGMGKGGILVL